MVKMYIWKQIEDVTTEHHTGGGLMIYTERDPLEVWKEYRQKKLEDEADRHRYRDADGLREDLPAADVILEGGIDNEDLIFVFPNTGCC